MPASMALVMPPSCSTSSMMPSAFAASACVSDSMKYEPPHGSITFGMPVSSWRMSCVLRATRADASVGSAMASSNELVCRLCVPPKTAAIASTVVRMMLLNGSCSVRLAPDVWQCVRSMSDSAFFGREVLLHERRPQQPRRAQLRHLHVEAHPDGEEERQAAGEGVDVEALRQRRAHVVEPVGDGERQLEVARRPGLLHVVAGDRDRVEARHLLRGVLDDVGHDPHRGRRRVDVGVADHELLQDVVLDGPRELGARHALLLAGDDEARQHRQHGAVHRHRHRHLVERDAVEEDASCPRRNRWPRRPCRRRRRRAGGRCRSRGGWRGRRRPTGPSARRPGWRGRRRSTPRRSRSRRTAGWSTASRRTWWRAARAGTGSRRERSRGSRAPRRRRACRAA